MMGVGRMHIREENDNIPFALLLLADPSENSIREHIYQGRCYVLEDEGEVRGAFIIAPNGPYRVELANIAVVERFRNRGYGKQMLQEAFRIARAQRYKIMDVGTGNSSIGQLAFYQKSGFRIVDIEKNYFIMNYEEKIFENGIQCCDLILLTKDLSEV